MGLEMRTVGWPKIYLIFNVVIPSKHGSMSKMRRPWPKTTYLFCFQCAMWWLSVAGLNRPDASIARIGVWTRYMEAENIENKLDRRTVVECDSAVKVQRLMEAGL